MAMGRRLVINPTGFKMELHTHREAVTRSSGSMTWSCYLLDHQTGLFQVVKDIPVAELRANTAMLAKAGELIQDPAHYHGF